MMGTICDVSGIEVGHFTDSRRPTGCTVILVKKGATGGVDVRGSAPGTRETDLLHPLNSVEKVHAVLLAGGSAFGLDSAAGVMQFLEEQGIGFDAQVARIPIVPAAILFDLNLGDPTIRPDKQSGYAACQNARADACLEGCVGVGAGATVGKLFGFEYAMKSGLGTASLQVGPWTVGAQVAVNAVGDVYDPRTGRILAGARCADGATLLDSMKALREGKTAHDFVGQNTTLAVVATNAGLDKSQSNKVAQMAQDGLARAINPVHTPFDGDTLFVLATGDRNSRSTSTPRDLTLLGALAAEAVSLAVCRAITTAKGLPGLPSYSDLVNRDRGDSDFGSAR